MLNIKRRIPFFGILKPTDFIILILGIFFSFVPHTMHISVFNTIGFNFLAIIPHDYHTWYGGLILGWFLAKKLRIGGLNG